MVYYLSSLVRLPGQAKVIVAGGSTTVKIVEDTMLRYISLIIKIMEYLENFAATHNVSKDLLSTMTLQKFAEILTDKSIIQLLLGYFLE
jgi:hypothetical protein